MGKFFADAIAGCGAHPFECMTAWSTLALAVSTVALAGFTLWLVRITRRAAAQELEERKSVTRLELMLRLTREYDSEPLLTARDKLALHFLSEGGEPDSKIAETLLDFFETMGHLARRELLDTQLLGSNFSHPVLCYWSALRPYVDQLRAKYRDATVYEDVEWLYQSLLTQARKLHRVRVAEPSSEVCKTFFEAETSDRPYDGRLRTI